MSKIKTTQITSRAKAGTLLIGDEGDHVQFHPEADVDLPKYATKDYVDEVADNILPHGNPVFHLNDTELRVDFDIPEGRNAATFGPIEQNATVDVPEGSSWVIIGDEHNTAHAGKLKDLDDTDIPNAVGEDTYLWYDQYTNSWKPKKIHGLDGTRGEDGEDGDSAYEVAVKNGFTGSEQDWLDSLNGEDGENGQEGPEGPQGLGWTGGSYDAASGRVEFTSNDALGFETGDLRGPKGSPGAGIHMKGSVDDELELPTIGNEIGDAYIDNDLGDLWIWGEDLTWHDAGHVVGPQGPEGPQGPRGDASIVPGPKGDKGDEGDKGLKGDPGNAQTVEVNSTTTGAPGEDASVTENAQTTNERLVLDFVIPTGQNGEDGLQGIPGEKGEDGESFDPFDDYTINGVIDMPNQNNKFSGDGSGLHSLPIPPSKTYDLALSGTDILLNDSDGSNTSVSLIEGDAITLSNVGNDGIMISAAAASAPDIPIGMISMCSWSDQSDLDAINSRNWFLCDGGENAETWNHHPLTSRVPDMRNLFVKGGGDWSQNGSIDGSESTAGHTTTHAQMPSHKHDGSSTKKGDHNHTATTQVMGTSADITTAGGSLTVARGTSFPERATKNAGEHSHAITVQYSGSGSAHAHIGVNPRHFVVAYIIYLGENN